MKMKNFFLIMFLSGLIQFNSAMFSFGSGHNQFVKRVGKTFVIDGKPYYYIGTNFWYGAILGSKGKDGNRDRLIKELDFMKSIGVNNLRILVGAEGPEDNLNRVQPSLQTEPGKYNQELLDGLDFLLAEMGKRKMVAILFLNNSWDWSGGYGQYLEWNGYGEAPCVTDKKVSWDEFQAFNGQFHTCEPCIVQFHNHIRFILGRKNGYTGKKYTDDPAIMAWEIGNEPRAFGEKFIPAFEKMVKSTAVLIKSIDHNHLLTTGTEGEMGCEGSIELFERIHSTPEIDYLTMHIWPLNWGWIKPYNIDSTFTEALAKTNDYMNKHIKIAKKLNKPIVVEEFGLPRDHYQFTTTDRILLRDRYYDNIFKKVAESSRSKGVVAGANFWTWGGFGRPVQNQVWYRRGDNYLGDPPCEEQGVNSVFNSDSTTISLVKKYNVYINRLKTDSLVSMKMLSGINISFTNIIRLSGGKPGIENDRYDMKLIGNSGDESLFKCEYKIKSKVVFKDDSIALITLSLPEQSKRDGKKFIGFFFDSIPGFKQGVEIWRYKPWNSWTKPIKVTSSGALHDWDIQFFYWQYSDGTYGAAIPLSGNGYRTTLGSENGKFGCKAYTYTENAPADSIPLMAIGVGSDPYKLFNRLYRSGLKAMGKAENIRQKKTFPKPLEYIGWCTWNSSHMGRDLDEKHLLDGASTFTDHHFPLGWLLIDDGWFDQDGSRLNAFTPNLDKFPTGFKPLIDKLKNQNGLKYVGAWHAYDGYWNGINPNSKLGEHYKNELFSWNQKEQVQVENSKIVTYHFIKPNSDSLAVFYNSFHTYLKDQGFSFIKVDNQLVSERMCVDNYPIGFLAEKMHQALYASTFKNFDGAIINCMDMTNEAFYNFGKSAVARAVEDYFPEADRGVGYSLEKGGAAAHVLMALYNSLYFSQMVWPDFDMFESYNSNAKFHAAARAISGGPIYITDEPGKQQFDILNPLIDAQGRIIRADQPAQLTRECLFQVQDAKPLKAFSFAGNSGLLAVFNAADADKVTGTISPSNVEGIEGEKFAVYEFFSGDLFQMKRNDEKPIELRRMGCYYYNIVPVQNGIALIGLVSKYNAPKTIMNTKIEDQKIIVQLNGGGKFKAILPKAPQSVLINGNSVTCFSFEKGVFTIEIGNIQSIENKLEIDF